MKELRWINVTPLGTLVTFVGLSRNLTRLFGPDAPYLKKVAIGAK